MSLINSSHQPPNQDKETTTEEGPIPDDTAAGQDPAASDDAAASDDTDVREDAAASEDASVDAASDDASEVASDDASDDGDDAAGDAVGESASDTVADGPDKAVAGGGWRDKYPAVVRAGAWVATGSAVVLVSLALLLPQTLPALKLSTFARVPVEGILGAALLLVLPAKARRVAALLAGVGLGLLTILKLLDMGFYSTLDRPFDLILDWILFDDAASALKDSVGRAGMIGAVIGVVVLVLSVLVLMTLSVVRLSRLMARHRAVATRVTWGLATVWMTCAALGAQIAGAPVASRGVTEFVQARADQVSAGLEDERAFAKQAARDDFGDTPADQLLTGLRGKDVIFTFIESYGRGAVEDPGMAPAVDAVLAEGTKRLSEAGYSSQSAWLTSPTFGGGSWLAHSTFNSGLWIKDQQRYRTVTSSDRMSLTAAFKRTGAWRTVGIMPGVTRSWPEANFYGLDHVYDSRSLGYEGPRFGWSRMPDQYSLSAFERLEHGKSGDKPLMSEIILTSSHQPWAPLPKTIGWDEVGDGSVYNAIHKAGKDVEDVWSDAALVRAEYVRSIQYSLNSLVDYVVKYGNKNTVLVFLGDHQPVPTVSGQNASRDVPIAIVAHDQAVLDRISGWNWHGGLMPGKDAPVWRMDAFRDHFLTAYGPQPGSDSTASPSTP